MLANHYRSLSAASNQALEDLLSDTDRKSRFSIAHNYTSDFESLLAAISDRPESKIFEYSVREYQFALYVASTGLYRHAFAGLRLFLELGLGAIHFSSQEILLRKWLNKTSDIKWGVLIDADKGLFSKDFLQAFNPNLEPFAKQYSTLAERVYRECSEFVHGNVHTHESAPQSLKFKPSTLDDWIDRAESARLCIIFSFASRYLQLLEKHKLQPLEQLMIENFGNLEPIRETFNK